MAIDFDEFRLEPATRRLLRAGAEVHLSPKAFDLLTLLIRNRAKAMAKADLHAWLWPETFVLESNLAGLVAEVRRALGDDADHPRFIRTVPRFGYWFVGRVSSDDTSGDVAASRGSERCWLMWDGCQAALPAGESVVGRAPDAAVWVDVPGVSRHHACIRLRGPDATIEDLGSKNGTFVNGHRITTPQRLADGDRLRLGSLVLTFRVPPPADPTGSAPPGASDPER